MIPVFIGGCGRSGTTMLASMLGSHSSVLTVPEYQCKYKILKKLDGCFSIKSVPIAIESMKNDIKFKFWDLNTLLNDISEKNFDGSYRQFIEYFVNLYGQQKSQTDFEFWVDHTPANISHTNLLLKEFPESKFLHIVRDGRAVAASVLPLDWGPNTIRRAAEAWQIYLSSGLAAEIKLPSDRFLRVHYENLVRHPRQVLTKICEFIGIEYEDGMELGKGFEVPGVTKKQHSLVGSLPNPDRIDSWKKQLSPTQIEYFEFYAGNTLELLGYETVNGNSASAPSSWDIFRMRFADAFKPYLKRLRYFKRNSETLRSIIARKNGENLKKSTR